MQKATEQILSALHRLDDQIDIQWGRMGMMQRWLDDHSQHIEALTSQVNEHISRIEDLKSQLKSI